MTAGAAMTVSSAAPLQGGVIKLIAATGARYLVQDAAAWATTLTGSTAPHRVRLLGGDRKAFAKASNARADIALYAQPVVEAGLPRGTSPSYTSRPSPSLPTASVLPRH